MKQFLCVFEISDYCRHPTAFLLGFVKSFFDYLVLYHESPFVQTFCSGFLVFYDWFKLRRHSFDSNMCRKYGFHLCPLCEESDIGFYIFGGLLYGLQRFVVHIACKVEMEGQLLGSPGIPLLKLVISLPPLLSSDGGRLFVLL